MRRLPKTLYVKVEADDENGYFVADTDDYSLAEKGERVKIGTYKLVEVNEAVMAMTSRKVK